MSEKQAPAPWLGVENATRVGDCGRLSTMHGDQRLGSALRALLVGVVFAIALSLTTTVAYAVLEQRLRAQEAKLAELLTRLPAAEVGQMLQRQPPDLTVSVRQHDTIAAASANRHTKSRLPDNVHDVFRRAAHNSDRSTHWLPAPGQHSTHLMKRSHRYDTVASDFEGLGYIEWDSAKSTDQQWLVDNRWLRVNVSGLYYVYSQVTWRPRLAIRGAILLHQIVMTPLESRAPHRQRHRRNETLASGSVTLSASRCRKSSVECPLQSSYTGGIFHIDSGASLAVSANASVTLTDKTFFGIYLLRSS